MRLFFWSIVGGLVGTGLMDIVGTFATDKSASICRFYEIVDADRYMEEN